MSMKPFKCRYCGKVKSWDDKNGDCPPPYDTNTPAGDACPRSPDKRHEYLPK